MHTAYATYGCHLVDPLIYWRNPLKGHLKGIWQVDKYLKELWDNVE